MVNAFISNLQILFIEMTELNEQSGYSVNECQILWISLKYVYVIIHIYVVIIDFTRYWNHQIIFIDLRLIISLLHSTSTFDHLSLNEVIQLKWSFVLTIYMFVIEVVDSEYQISETVFSI